MTTAAQSTDVGGRTSALVETRSIDYVPDDERHGKVSHQGPFWFVGNFQPFTLALGFVGPSLGLSLWWTIVAGLAGIAFGTLFMAFHATQGPVLGLPQMIQSRAQFGYRGVLVPLIGTLFTFVGFNVVDVVIIKSGLQSIFGWNPVVVAVVITVIAALVAVFGHDLLHKTFRILFWVSLPLWIVLTWGVLFGGVTGTATATGGFSFVAFLVQFSVAASYNITYAPYVSDYSRYLPRTSDCAQSSGTTHPRRPDEVPASGFRRQSSLPASRFRHRTRCRQRGFPGATFLPQEADGVIGSLGRGARCHFWHLADGAIHIRLRLHRPNVGFPTHSLDPTTATPSPR